MSEEKGVQVQDEEMEMVLDEGALVVAENTFDEFLQVASVDSVYGDPIKEGDTLILPAAEVLALLGFGVGSGHGRGYPPPDESTEGENNTGGDGAGSGGGGGGRILARPAAVVIATPAGVRVEPVVDLTKIVLAGITAAGFMLGMVLRMMRPSRNE